MMDRSPYGEEKAGAVLPAGCPVAPPIPLLARGVVGTICTLVPLGCAALGARIFLHPAMFLPARRGPLLVLILLLAVLGVVLRMAARRLGRDFLSPILYRSAMLVPPISLAAVCIPPVLTAPFRESWSLPVVAAAAWLASELLFWGQRRRAGRADVITGSKIVKPPEASGEEILPPDSSSSLPETGQNRVVQQSVRHRTERGAEMISGTVRGDLPAGAERISLHVVFCPALDRTPHVEAEPIDGPWSEIEAIHAYPHGVRFDIKLAAPTQDEAAVTVQYFVSTEPE